MIQCHSKIIIYLATLKGGWVRREEVNWTCDSIHGEVSFGRVIQFMVKNCQFLVLELQFDDLSIS